MSRSKHFSATIFFAIITVATCALLSAQDYEKDGWIDRNKNGTKDPYEDPQRSTDERIADLLSKMTIEEKTCQMGTIYGYKRVLKSPVPVDNWKKRVWKDGVGNIDEHCNGVRKESEYTGHVEHGELLNQIQRWFIEETRLGVPVDFTNEGIRGVCHQSASNFPSQLAIGATFDRDLVRRIGEVTGTEAKALGYTNIYSPILDTVRDPRWGRTIECYGESPYLVGEMGVQQVLGLQASGVASTTKHFAAYSNPNGGRDARGRTDPQIPFRDMHEILLHPFEKVFTQAHPWGTMSSYNTYDGIPVTGSSYFLQELLRDTYGFNGYVVSDSGAVTRLHRQHAVAENFKTAVAMAVNAGLNVRTNFKKMEEFVLALREVIQDGRVSEDTIDQRVADVLRVKFELGLFDSPFVDAQSAPEIVHKAQHVAATLESARKSIVLLSNESQQLPLNLDSVATILVTGPGADDASPMISRYGPGTSDVITPLAGIRQFVGDKTKVLYSKGVDFHDKNFPGSEIIPVQPDAQEQQGIDDAVAMASNADVIVAVMGDDHSTVGESLSRTSLELPGYQLQFVQELVATGKPVIVVLMIGRAASVKWIHENAAASLVCWHGGEKIGQAVAETLFGQNNPGGKLPITFPQTVGQIPLAIPHRRGAWGAQSKTTDPNGFGSTRAVDPLYPFGYGLSYTSFSYKDLKIEPAIATADEEISVSCTVTNTGELDGDEVVQLYIQDVYASVAPFDQILRGFQRISLKAGESKAVNFKIKPQQDLKMLDQSNQWVVEPGKFEVRVGTASDEKGIRLREEFQIK